MVGILALTLTSCTAARSLSSKTPNQIAELSACSSKSEFAQKLGAADQQISIPGGGHIDVHDVLVRNPDSNYNQAESVAISVLSLGIVDLTAGLGDTIYDCEQISEGQVSGYNSKCDYQRLQFFIHYPDSQTDTVSCVERKEVWSGSTFFDGGDKSRCPIEYKQALADLIDTSAFPPSTLSWDPGDRTLHQQLQFMAADHQAKCP
jgi:hypothetical protein